MCAEPGKKQRQLTKAWQLTLAFLYHLQPWRRLWIETVRRWLHQLHGCTERWVLSISCHHVYILHTRLHTARCKESTCSMSSTHCCGNVTQKPLEATVNHVCRRSWARGHAVLATVWPLPVLVKSLVFPGRVHSKSCHDFFRVHWLSEGESYGRAAHKASKLQRYRLWLSLNQPKFKSELELHGVGRVAPKAPYTLSSHSSLTAAAEAEAAAQHSHFRLMQLGARGTVSMTQPWQKKPDNDLKVMSYYLCGRHGRDFSSL